MGIMNPYDDYDVVSPQRAAELAGDPAWDVVCLAAPRLVCSGDELSQRQYSAEEEEVTERLDGALRRIWDKAWS